MATNDRRSSEEPTPTAQPRAKTRLLLSTSLLAEAHDLGVDVTQAAERGIALVVAQRRQERWLEKNRASSSSSDVPRKDESS